MAARKIDLNTASVEELESLIGVGHAKAEAIIEARKANGGLTDVSDLVKISGIGPSLLEQNRGVLTCVPLKPQSPPATSPQASKRCIRETRSSSVHSKSYSCTSPDPSSSDCAFRSSGRESEMKSTKREGALSPKKRVLSWRDSPRDNSDTSSADEEEEDAAIDDGRPTDSGFFLCKNCAGSADRQPSRESPLKEVLSNEAKTATHEEEQASTSKSRILSASEKHWMKRKSSESGQDAKGQSPGKKPCRYGDNTPSDSDEAEESAGLSSSLKGTLPSSSLRKQRIRSRGNPPPELAQWLRTFQTWSHPERLLALDELVENCEPTQIRHLMHVIEPQFQRDFISLLPRELALYVLSFLDPKDLLHAAQTCQYWRILAEDNLLWREKCREEGIDEALVFGPKSKRRAMGGKSPWKSLYMRQMQIEQNWRSNPLKPPKLLRGHDDHVITCLEFCGNRIVSGSDDNTLKVWSAITGRCLRTLVGHMGGVWSSQMSDNIIVSGSTDRTLKVWNADTGQCLHTLFGHNSTVRCMHLYNNKVISGSRDATLRMWDIVSGSCEHIFMGHVAAVRCVQYDGKRVVSGAYDYMVKVWDPETETCIHTLQGHSNRVYSLQFDGVHIVSGSLDTSIRVWDVETGNCLHTLIGHQSLTSGMELKDNILVSGNADSTVKVWDITTGQCLQTLQGPNKHQSAVTCLQFNRRFVITSSDDGTVKIWDLRTGEFLRNLVTLSSGGSGGVVWRLRYNNTKLVCAVGSRNGTEETKVMVFDFDVEDSNSSNAAAIA